MKQTGSDIFGTSIINTEEYLLMAKTITEDGSSAERAILEIDCIDDMLNMQRMSSIYRTQRFTVTGKLRKNSSIQDFLNNRIGVLLEDTKKLNEW